VTAAAALAFLAALTLVNSAWLYPSDTDTDAIAYLGLFQLFDTPNLLVFEYRLMRLPWVASGWLAYAVFPPWLAGFLVGAVPVAGVAALVGYLAQRHGPPRAGVLAATMATTLPWMHQLGVGATYHNAFATLAWLAALAWWHRPWVAGVALGVALLDNILLVNLLPATLMIAGRPSRTQAVPLAAGATLSVLASAAACVAVGRPPAFFAPLLSRVGAFLSDPSLNVYHQSWREWLPDAGWMGALVAAAVVARRRQDPWQRAFLVSLVIWVVWQLLGQTALDWARFAYPLLPLAIVVLARHAAAPNATLAWACGLLAGAALPGSALVSSVLAGMAVVRRARWTPAVLGVALALGVPSWSVYAPDSCDDAARHEEVIRYLRAIATEITPDVERVEVASPSRGHDPDICGRDHASVVRAAANVGRWTVVDAEAPLRSRTLRVRSSHDTPGPGVVVTP
jgi:hypothetical protein